VQRIHTLYEPDSFVPLLRVQTGPQAAFPRLAYIWEQNNEQPLDEEQKRQFDEMQVPIQEGSTTAQTRQILARLRLNAEKVPYKLPGYDYSGNNRTCASVFLYFEERKPMIWNNLFFDRDVNPGDLVRYFADSFAVDPCDVQIIDGIEQIAGMNKRIILLLEASHEFPGKDLVTIYFGDGMSGDVSSLACMAQKFGVNIFLPDEESRCHRDFILIDGSGVQRKIAL
jgi:hypothetical protein